MKSKIILIGLITTSSLFFACEKDCHECHYDFNDTQVELGEKCGDELADLEANGYSIDSINYEVHCHEH